MNAFTSLLLLLSAIGIATSQLLVKKGSHMVQQTLHLQGDYQITLWVKKIFYIVFEPHIFIALILNFLVLFSWLKVLSKTELSLAYPILISLTILITSISSIFVFKETVTGYKILGMSLVVAGLFLIANSK